MSIPDPVWADKSDPLQARFFRACEAGDLAGLKSALRPGVNLNALHGQRGSHGETPLHAAIQNGHLHIIGYLLALGADMETRSTPHNCNTALQWAASAASPEIVRLLIDSGADMDAKFYGGAGDVGPVLFLPLGSVFPAGGHRPVEQKHYDTLALLLAEGLDINAPGSLYGEGNLIERAVRCNDPALVKWLLDRGANPTKSLVRLAKTFNYGSDRTLKYLVEDLGLKEEDEF